MTIQEQIVIAAIFCFGQVFVFCRLINKNVLEWFLLMCQEHTLTKSTNFLVETISHNVFDQEQKVG